MNFISGKILFFSFTIFLSSCSTYRAPYIAEKYKNWEKELLPSIGLQQTIFLIGDAGEPTLQNQEPTLKLLESQLKAAGEKSAVAFLGDNVYPVGIPPEDDRLYELAFNKLCESLMILDSFQGKPFFVPGNHDWNSNRSGGRAAILRMEKIVEEYLDRGNTFLPDNACADPVHLKLNEKLVLLFIDTQWWIHNWEGEPEMNSGCELKTREDFLLALKNFFGEYHDHQIIVLMHHPLYSNGSHGGKFALKEYIFPLIPIREYLYVPLPVLGTLLALYRTLRGTDQDLPHPEYKGLKKAILSTLDDESCNVIFAAGHDHNLQYFKKEKHHYIVSGSGSKLYSAIGRGGVSFAYTAHGFAKLYHYENGEMWLEFVVPKDEGEKFEIPFRARIVAPRTENNCR